MKTDDQDLPLQRALHWERVKPDSVYLTQPVGGGQVETYTWRQVLDEARRMAAHLRSLDLEPGSRIGLVTANCAHFIICELAIWMAGHVTVALYPTLTADSVRYMLEHSETKLLFVGKGAGWKQMKSGVPEGLPIIALPLGPKDEPKQWRDIIAQQEPLSGDVTRPADDLAMVVYTSGTTGEPKGVVHSFRNMAAYAKGLCEVHEIFEEDRAISYLPLAHVYERALIETSSLYCGVQVFFVESLETFLDDLRRARPTIFHSVPRLWLKFQLGVFEKVPPKRLELLLKIPVVSTYIRRKILSGLGLESVRVAASAAAPIPPEVLDWYGSLGLELLEGYGMSENFGYSHTTVTGRKRVGYVGEPLPGVEQRLSEEGEVLVKSPASMLGYFKDEATTKASFTDDGFLKTGDRGEIDDQGRLKITGRVKELFKTSKGKYVAPAPIENLLNNHPSIESACVMGVGKPQPYALLVLAPEQRPRLDSNETRPAVEGELESLLVEVNQRIEAYEHLAFLSVVRDDWTVDNGMLTPTMKVKRSLIEDAYRAREDAWYAEKRKVLVEDAAKPSASAGSPS